MPNGHGHKEYGDHKYADHDGTSDCQYHCGCWMGPARSGGPIGLDPHGTCPGNPRDGAFLGGNADYEHVVGQRIRDLETRVYRAESLVRRTKPTKKKLAAELESAQSEIARKNQLLNKVRELLNGET